MAAEYDFEVDQGSTKRFSFVWKQNVGTDIAPDYQPYDLTGCTARMQVRVAHGKPVLVEISDSTSDGSLTIDGPSGQINIWLSDENTDLISVTSSKYDLEVTFPSGDTYRVLQGKITTSLAITQ